MGIQPDFIVARSEKYLDQRRRDRFALFCNMSGDAIISNPDVETVYEVPLILHQQTLDSKIQEKLGLPVRVPNLSDWERLVTKIKANKSKSVEIAIVGKYRSEE